MITLFGWRIGFKKETYEWHTEDKPYRYEYGVFFEKTTGAHEEHMKKVRSGHFK